MAFLTLSIPHDGAAFFLYALLIFCFVLVWRANRGRSGGPGAGTRTPPDPSRKRSR